MSPDGTAEVGAAVGGEGLSQHHRAHVRALNVDDQPKEASP